MQPRALTNWANFRSTGAQRCLCWLSLKTLLWWLFQMYALCIGFELRDTYRIISNFSFIPFLWINNLNPLLLTASFISMPQYFNKRCYSAEHLHRESSCTKSRERPIFIFSIKQSFTYRKPRKTSSAIPQVKYEIIGLQSEKELLLFRVNYFWH